MRDEISYKMLKVSINNEQHIEAKKLAKKQGMTLQGWLGSLIKRELNKEVRA